MEYGHVESILIVHDKREIILETEWQVIGGPTLRFDLFGGEPKEFFAWIGGSYLCDWCDLQIRVVERYTDESKVDLMANSVILANNQNTRKPLGVPTTIPPSQSGNVFQVEARRTNVIEGRIASAWLSNLTISLLRWE